MLSLLVCIKRLLVVSISDRVLHKFVQILLILIYGRLSDSHVVGTILLDPLLLHGLTLTDLRKLSAKSFFHLGRADLLTNFHGRDKLELGRTILRIAHSLSRQLNNFSFNDFEVDVLVDIERLKNIIHLILDKVVTVGEGLRVVNKTCIVDRLEDELFDFRGVFLLSTWSNLSLRVSFLGCSGLFFLATLILLSSALFSDLSFVSILLLRLLLLLGLSRCRGGGLSLDGLAIVRPIGTTVGINLEASNTTLHF